MCRFVPVLVALLSGASSGLAGAAADVLAEVVLKRMDPAAKLRCGLLLSVAVLIPLLLPVTSLQISGLQNLSTVPQNAVEIRCDVLQWLTGYLTFRLVQQLGLGPLIAAWADNQLRDPSAAEDVGPQCARLLAALVTGWVTKALPEAF